MQGFPAPRFGQPCLWPTEQKKLFRDSEAVPDPCLQQCLLENPYKYSHQRLMHFTPMRIFVGGTYNFYESQFLLPTGNWDTYV